MSIYDRLVGTACLQQQGQLNVIRSGNSDLLDIFEKFYKKRERDVYNKIWTHTMKKL